MARFKYNRVSEVGSRFTTLNTGQLESHTLNTKIVAILNATVIGRSHATGMIILRKSSSLIYGLPRALT